MQLLRVDPGRPDPRVVAKAGRVLREGGLVAFPTETVYGLGADALSEGAVRRIFDAKGRPSHNPLIVHVADAAAARRLARDWPATAARLAAALWPGPVTLVVPRAQAVPDIVTAGLDTVAIRVPSHPVALALLREAKIPVAAPSANPSSGVSPTRAEHVVRSLGDRVDVVLDGGATAVGIESAVVDLSGAVPTLLRPGTVTVSELERAAGTTIALGASAAVPPGEAPRSPGRIGRHYAPRAAVVLFDPDRRGEAVALAEREAAAGRRVCALLREDLEAPLHHRRIMPGTADAYARQLYAALHDADEAGCDVVLIERVPVTGAWTGVRDRLERAATTPP